MKKKSLNRLSAFFNILLVVLLLLPNFLVSASVFAYDFPSTNQLNKDTGVRPYVEPNEIGVGYIKFNFINNHTKSLAFFEYKIDGNEKTSGTVHPVTGDFIYPGVSVDTRLILTPLTIERTLDAEQYIEIRLALGGERDWDFDWTRFDVLPVPVPPSIPVLEYPIDGVAIKDNTPLMQWSNSTDSDGTISHYLYRVFYNCTNMENIPGSCSVFPNLTGLRLNESQYQAGTTNDNTYYWQVRAVDNDGNLSEWSKLGAFTVDTTNPNTTLVPPEGLTGNTFAVSGEAEDNISLNRVYVQLVHKQTSQRYGGTTIYLSGTKQDWSQTFDATKLGMPEGDYAAHVAVVDNAGNTSSVGWSEYFQVDKTPPVITISSPLNNEVLRTPERKLKVFGSISDNIATNYIHIQIVDSKGNSRGVYTVHGTKSEELLVELDVKDLQDGEYKIYYWGVDRVGNVSERPYITILLDNTAPVAPTLTSPSNDSFVKGDLLESKWKKIDDAHNYIYESYHDAEAKNLRYHQEYATNSKSATNVSESTFWWRVKAVDAAGNASDWSELWKVTVDNTPPKGEIMGIRYEKADSTNFITNDKTPLLYGTCSDNYGVDKVEVVIGETTLTSTCNEGNWTTELPELPDGDHEITLKITDKAGNVTTITKDITIDSIAPFAVYTHYIKGELFDGDIAEVKSLSDLSFTGVYTDPDPSSGLKYDSYVIFQAQDNGSFGFSANGKQSYCSWRTSPNLVDLSGSTYNLTDQIPFTNCIASLPDGEYYMSHQVFDNAVRNDIPTISQFRDVLGLHFKINNTPVVTIATPFTEVVQGVSSFTVQAEAVDGNAPLTYEWTASNGFTSTEDFFVFIPAAIGVYTYTVKVTDADGDIDQESVTITVKAPVVQPVLDTPAVLGTTTTTTPTPTPVVTRRPLVAASVFETTSEVVEEVPEILGEEDISCIVKPVSGHVYMDKNEDNTWDQDDKSFSNIRIKITIKENGEEEIVKELITNEEGEWKTTLCAGKYLVSIDTTSIPENYKLNGDSTIQIDVLEGDTKGVEQSFLLTESKTFLQKYWWILLLAILVVTSIVIAGSKKDEKQSS